VRKRPVFVEKKRNIANNIRNICEYQKKAVPLQSVRITIIN